MACKISAAVFAVVIALFIVARLWRTRGITRRRAALEAVTLLVAAFLAFRIAHPIAFQGTAQPSTLWGLLDVRPFQPPPGGQGFWQSVQEQKGISEGTRDVPWNVQWIGRRDFLWPLRNLLLWGTGLPLGLAAGIGTGLILWRAVGGRPSPRLRHPSPTIGRGDGGEGISPSSRVPFGLLVAALWVLVVFLYYGGQFSKFTRYYLPATPFLALCAASLLLERMRDAGGRINSGRLSFILHPSSFILLTVIPTALWALAFTSIYTRPHTRVAASQWIRRNIPPGIPVAVESSWDDALPLGGPVGLKVLNLELYGRDTNYIYEPDSPAKRQALLNKLDQAAWVFISSNRVWGSIPRWPQRWPLTTAYYRALFDGRLGFEPVREFASYPRLFGVPLRDDGVEEALTVYDHPRVVLFMKTPAWSRANAERILHSQLLHAVSDAPLEHIRDSGWNPEAQGQPPLPWLPSPMGD